MKKKFALFFAVSALPLISPAIDLKQAKFTQVVNEVKVVSASAQEVNAASVNDVFKMPDVLRTGPSSRAELVADDKTVTRVGANTIFSYDKENRTIDLQRGSLLFHSPHGKGGGTIHAAAVTAAVLGTTLIVSVAPDGAVKVLDLEGRVEVRLKNGHRQILESGQMIFIPADGKESPVATFSLGDLTKNSLLVSGFTQPLPSLQLINDQITLQTKLLDQTVGGAVAAANGTVNGALAGTTTTAGNTLNTAGGTVGGALNTAGVPLGNTVNGTLNTALSVIH